MDSFKENVKKIASAAKKIASPAKKIASAKEEKTIAKTMTKSEGNTTQPQGNASADIQNPERMSIVDAKLIANAKKNVEIKWPRDIKKGGGDDEECKGTLYKGAAQEQVCEIINEVVKNKIDSKRAELDQIPDQVVTQIRDKLEGTMLKTIHKGFNDKIEDFYKKVVNTPENDTLLESIIGEIGMKFDDALANGVDGRNIEAYNVAIKSLQDAKAKAEKKKAEEDAKKGGKKTKKKQSKTNKKKLSKINKKKLGKTIKKKKLTRKKR